MLAVSLLLAACSDGSPGGSDGTGGFALRGLIEGFYGAPYEHAARLDVLRFAGERHMNAYVYAPKNDPRHRDLWREPYPSQQMAEFGELASLGRELGLRFYFAISPGITYGAEDEASDWVALSTKLRAFHDVGVSGFALLFDDLLDPASTALDPELQASLTARVEKLVAGFGGDTDFLFIGHLYLGTAADLIAGRDLLSLLSPFKAPVYYEAYERHVPSEVPILWTGPGVFSARLTRTDAADFVAFAKRPAVIWDNFPVNDSLPEEIFLGPYLGRDADLHEAAHGVLLNLMSQPTAGLIAVSTAADALRDPARYDPERSWQDAVDDVGGNAARTLAAFADAHRGHPVLAGAVEAPELGRRIERAFPVGAPLGPAEDVAALRDYLTSLATHRVVLERDLPARFAGFIAEVEPWSRKLEGLALAALLGLDALSGGGDPSAYMAARTAAEAGRWLVAAQMPAQGLAALSGGRVNPAVDRFHDLFTAIDERL